jgi:hypothetical protein
LSEPISFNPESGKLISIIKKFPMDQVAKEESLADIFLRLIYFASEA